LFGAVLLTGLAGTGPVATADAAEDAQPAAPVPVAVQVATDEPAAKPVAAGEKVDVPGAIAQLSDADFAVRNLATERLVSAGADAIAPVEKAAGTGDLELATRCVRILDRLGASKDETVRREAGAALDRLAKSDNKSVAQRAAGVLARNKPAPDAVVPGQGQVQIQIGVVGGAGGVVRPLARLPIERENTVEKDGKKIRIQETAGGPIVVTVTEKVDGQEKTTETKAANAAELLAKHKAAHDLYVEHLVKANVPYKRVGRAAVGGGVIAGGGGVIGGGGNFQIRTKIENGNRETEVDDNGRKISIKDVNGSDIRMKVTETVEGKEQTKEYSAKDLEELRKTHPEAAKIYEQYSGQGNGAFRIFGKLQALPAQLLPVVPEQE
jgi:hypothetical protein